MLPYLFFKARYALNPTKGKRLSKWFDVASFFVYDGDDDCDLFDGAGDASVMILMVTMTTFVTDCGLFYLPHGVLRQLLPVYACILMGFVGGRGVGS